MIFVNQNEFRMHVIQKIRLVFETNDFQIFVFVVVDERLRWKHVSFTNFDEFDVASSLKEKWNHFFEVFEY